MPAVVRPQSANSSVPVVAIMTRSYACGCTGTISTVRLILARRLRPLSMAGGTPRRCRDSDGCWRFTPIRICQIRQSRARFAAPLRCWRPAKGTIKISAQLDAAGFVADADIVTTAAHSATLQPASGDRWCAAGDAAISFDPLSLQGRFNAMYTGLAAALACDRRLRGERIAFDEYSHDLRRIETAYLQHLEFWYRQEKRRPDSAFWQRRCKVTYVTNVTT